MQSPAGRGGDLRPVTAKRLRGGRVRRILWATAIGMIGCVGCGGEVGTFVAPGGVFAATERIVESDVVEELEAVCTVVVPCGARCCGEGLRCEPDVRGRNRCVDDTGTRPVGATCGRSLEDRCEGPGLCLALVGADARCRVPCTLGDAECGDGQRCLDLGLESDPAAGACVPQGLESTTGGGAGEG